MREERRSQVNAWLYSSAFGLVSDTRAWMDLKGKDPKDSVAFPSESFEAAFRRAVREDAAKRKGSSMLQGPAATRDPTCAVVSSSGRLALHKHGEEIDAHDAVIRMNNAPAGGEFKEHVGERTTLRVSNFEVAQNLTYGRNGYHEYLRAPLVLTRDADDANMTRFYRDGKNWVKGKSEVFRLSNTFMAASGFPFFHSNDVNTGVYAVAAALMVCGKISLYEMVPSDEPVVDSCEYHYYETGFKQTPCPTSQNPCWHWLETHTPCFANDMKKMGSFWPTGPNAGKLLIQGEDLEKWRSMITSSYEHEENWGK